MSHPVRIFGYLIIGILITSCKCDEEVCNRIPLGIKTTPLPPDDRYYLKVENIGENYLPGHPYQVFLKGKDNATFIGFTISAYGAEKENEKKGRQPRIMNPGVLRVSILDDNTKEGCNNSIIQNHIMPKNSVQVTWEAPPKDNGCVTLYAYVAIKMEVYYNNQGPLTKRICEDTHKLEDMLPKVNADCQVCEDAKYKLTFEGLWSENTHYLVYPTSNTTQASFSEIVGASHNKDYTIFKSNNEANEGVKMLAEQGNTTRLEMDMQEKIGQNIRSIIKTNRPATTNSTITAMFRVTREYHLVSLVTAILPSPDWFLGASHMELCDADRNEWADDVVLNLYPMDAGTDKGTDFNSANDEMMPAAPIRPASFRNVRNVKPFARIKFDLIRIYHLTPNCFEKPQEEDKDSDGNEAEAEAEAGSEDSGDETEETVPTEDKEESSPMTTSTTEAPMVTDPDSPENCPMTEWQEWSPCEGPCEGGKRYGAHTRYRYHVVDGVTLKEASEDVPPECLDQDQDIEICEEECEETTDAPLLSQQQVAPGTSWRDWLPF